MRGLAVGVGANGELLKIWGGPIRAALGGSYERDSNKNTAVTVAGFPVVATPTTFDTVRSTRAAFGEQCSHVSAARADFEYAVGGSDREFLQHACLELGREHAFAELSF